MMFAINIWIVVIINVMNLNCVVIASRISRDRANRRIRRGGKSLQPIEEEGKMKITDQCEYFIQACAACCVAGSRLESTSYVVLVTVV